MSERSEAIGCVGCGRKRIRIYDETSYGEANGWWACCSCRTITGPTRELAISNFLRFQDGVLRRAEKEINKRIVRGRWKP
jgi:hypothetical protein